MAQNKKENPKEKIKSRFKKQIDATNEKAKIFNGEKEKLGKYQTKKPKTEDKKEDVADLDKFFTQVEEGFLDIRSVRDKDEKPYDGLLGRVEVERLNKTTNK